MFTIRNKAKHFCIIKANYYKCNTSKIHFVYKTNVHFVWMYYFFKKRITINCSLNGCSTLILHELNQEIELNAQNRTEKINLTHFLIINEFYGWLAERICEEKVLNVGFYSPLTNKEAVSMFANPGS